MVSIDPHLTGCRLRSQLDLPIHGSSSSSSSVWPSRSFLDPSFRRLAPRPRTEPDLGLRPGLSEPGGTCSEAAELRARLLLRVGVPFMFESDVACLGEMTAENRQREIDGACRIRLDLRGVATWHGLNMWRLQLFSSCLLRTLLRAEAKNWTAHRHGLR